MIIDAISDLRGFYPKLEGGDLLIVAGDLTSRDMPLEHLDFIDWCKGQLYKKIIVVAGNHDNFIQNLKCKYFARPVYKDHCEYLCDSGTEFEIEEQIEDDHWTGKSITYKRKRKFKIWGSPWTKTFKGMNPKCKAFTVDADEELASKFSLIPNDVDILITHSPPYGILDKTMTNESVGSKSLALKVGKMENPPQLWVWGHIHEAYGEDLPVRSKHCKMLNASHVNAHYEPVNKPIRVIL